jgi:hypothetical protein
VYVVNSAGDTGTGSGLTGDLRYCITQANSAGGTNTINFDNNLFATPQTITLLSALPVITDDNLIIHGPGASLVTISGNKSVGVLQITANDALIDGLTIANGLAPVGGGLDFSGTGTLKLTHSVLSGNSATQNGGAAANSSGNLYMSYDTLTGNQTTAGTGLGGAIYNQGTLTLYSSTLSGNHSYGSGGALANNGQAMLGNCTLNSNYAAVGYNSGGAVYNRTAATVTLNFCYMNGNSANNGRGGAVFNAGTATIEGSSMMVANNSYSGGALYNGGVTMLTNTTLISNSSKSGGGIFNAGMATLFGTSLYSNSASYAGGALCNGTGNVGSAAMVKIDACTLAGNSTSGLGGALSNNLGATMVVEDQSTVTGNFTTSNYGQGGGLANFGTFTLSHSTLSGNTAAVGGGILNRGQATLRYATLSNNTTTSGNGGGLYNDTSSSSATLTNSTLSGNTAATNGGGIYNAGYVNCNGFTTLSGNATTNGLGGGLFNKNSAKLTNVNFSNNTSSAINASSAGGGIENSGTLTVTDSLLSGNKALSGNGIDKPYNGAGGIDSSGFLGLYDATLTGNVSYYGDGGGIRTSGIAVVDRSTFSGNKATDASLFVSRGAGGAIFCSDNFTMTNSTLSGNYGKGGGILEYDGTGTLTNCTISGNTGAYGAWFGYNYFPTATLTNCTLSGNAFGQIIEFGGANVNSIVTLNNTVAAGASGNQADAYGVFSSNSVNNFIGDGYHLYGISNGSNGNLVGTPQNPIDPQLSGLGNFGGPTLTMKPFAGSPLLAAGDPTLPGLPPTDQRGGPRLRDGTIDIGAVERLSNENGQPAPFNALVRSPPAIAAGALAAPQASAGLPPSQAFMVTGPESAGVHTATRFDLGSPTKDLTRTAAPPRLYRRHELGSPVQQLAPTLVTAEGAFPSTLEATDAPHNGVGSPESIDLTNSGPGAPLTVDDTQYTTDPGRDSLAAAQETDGLQNCIVINTTNRSSADLTSSAVRLSPIFNSGTGFEGGLLDDYFVQEAQSRAGPFGARQ